MADTPLQVKFVGPWTTRPNLLEELIAFFTEKGFECLELSNRRHGDVQIILMKQNGKDDVDVSKKLAQFKEKCPIILTEKTLNFSKQIQPFFKEGAKDVIDLTVYSGKRLQIQISIKLNDLGLS